MSESMTAVDRVKAAVALEPVDRHPVFPILVNAAPRLYGITQGQAWRDHDQAREAMIWCWETFGYDFGSKPNYYYPMLPGRLTSAPVRNLIPGRQLEEDDLFQIDERILFSRKDYDKIAALGWNQFWEEHYQEMSNKSFEQFKQMQSMSNRFYMEDNKICEEKGMNILIGAAVDSVLMSFSLCRTLTEFTKDLYEVPDKVEAAMKACAPDIIANAIELCKMNDKSVAFMVLERGSGFFYRLPIFERFEWPFIQEYVDAFLSEGILPWLHMDTDWIMNLPYLKKLPKGKCVCDLDGTTDIFKAKEILGGHMCISGDVPASLLTLGRPEEVEEYCRRLIDVVGLGGGFMLTTGCECPIDVKPENLRAMVETGKTYLGGKGRASAAKTETEIAAPKEVSRLEGEIARALGDLKFELVMELLDRAAAENHDPMEILNQCRAGMDRVGELYSRGDYFLAELIMSADIFKKAAQKLEPLLAEGQTGSDLGALVIATPKGDIHDLGKNIVAILCSAAGFEVHDLGVDVLPETIAAKVEETGARVLAMSALITPTFESMKKTVELLAQKGLRKNTFIIIGGGPTTAAVRDYTGVDAWTLNPKEGLNLSLEFIRSGRGDR